MTDDRKELTTEDAYSLVIRYVNSLWNTYRGSVGSMDKEDVVQEIMLKLISLKNNPNYNPNFKPGDTVTLKKGRGEGRYETYNTDYMLDDDYDPEDPYDSVYHIIKKPTFTYIEKYDGRTTSKPYYIMNIVKKSLIDMAKKRDAMKGATSLSTPVGDDGEDNRTLQDMIPGDNSAEDIEKADTQRQLQELMMELINRLPNPSVTDMDGRKGKRGAIGWSPLTGVVDSNGNKVQNTFTLRDAAMHLLMGYTPEEVSKFYVNPATGQNISVGSVSSKYAEVRKALLKLIQELPEDKREFLKGLGYKL